LLAPRLHHFLSSQPDLDVRVSATQSFANFMGDGVDVAIRNTAGPFPGLWARKFLAIETLPVVAPRLIDQYGPLNGPADLVRFPIIHDDSLGRMFGLPTWVDWLKAAGAENLDLGRGLHFSSADHAIEAALEGAGVLLAPKALALDDVRLGRLVMPFALTIGSNRAFHVVCPEGHETRPKIAAFCAWVLDEAAKQGLACADSVDAAAKSVSRKRATAPESDPTPTAPAKAALRPRRGRAPRSST
jgi:LysR family transcriptional regulator, glycine cleavage system transcriptional activator